MTKLLFNKRIKSCSNSCARNLLSIMEAKETVLAFSADLTDAEELLKLADAIGPSICVLKTHIDLVDNFTIALTQQLQKLAVKHQFLLFEDRKFADLGNTVRLQYQRGIHKISDWADIINAHALPGPGTIEGLRQIGLPKQRGLLLVAEMSAKDNLLTESYRSSTVSLAKQYKDFVIGFIAQTKIADDSFIYFTPGVQFAVGTDSLGQQYNTPENVIINQGSDIIIVGRGIIETNDPIATAQRYKKISWELTKEKWLSRNSGGFETR